MTKLMNNKYLSQSDIQNLDILKKSIVNKSINVTCMGLYNHGKSSLLNVLIKDFDDKTFKAADIRETTENKSFEYENITYIDTPGLNAELYDDKRVFDAVKESDINLFVHRITTGEFVEKEIEFLKRIKNHWLNPEEFINRTIFVLSMVDEVNDDNDIDLAISKMNNQINEIFQTNPLIIPISAKRYKNGIVDNKMILVKKSNIEELQIKINEMSEKLIDVILETRNKRLQNNYDELIKKCNSKLQEKKFELSKQKKQKEVFLKNLEKDVAQIENTLENMYKRLGE